MEHSRVNEPTLGPLTVSFPTAVPCVGTAPVNWNNRDLPDWRTPTKFPAILDEMVAAGYEGTEYGAEFPSDPAELLASLAPRGLRLSGAYQWLHLQDNDRLERELADLEHLLATLAAVGSTDLVIADVMTPERIGLAGHVPSDGRAGLQDADWHRLACNAAAVARQAAGWGIRTHYHNHVGTYVETPSELDRLLNCLDFSTVDLCFDTGHYAYGGGDPTTFIAEHHDRIGYLHLKDVCPLALAEARERGWSFLDALRHCIFCEFGDGIVDIPLVVETLRASGYGGWIVVEQDTSGRPSTESATASRRFLREQCGI